MTQSKVRDLAHAQFVRDADAAGFVVQTKNGVPQVACERRMDLLRHTKVRANWTGSSGDWTIRPLSLDKQPAPLRKQCIEAQQQSKPNPVADSEKGRQLQNVLSGAEENEDDEEDESESD